ncbi:MAG TPA: cysteine--tRNA ligase [Candidatus Saccharibacteria bacterium]|nr:cysteine--tRNA ligase [Candidatus Saccharibacteria bacterium]
MTIKLHNTVNNLDEVFVPIKEGQASIYTCGPTVYNYQHIGNWSAYIYWDILVRTLLVNNFEVKRVLNITDVGHLVSDADEGEDKLEKGAKREGKSAWEIAEFYTDDFLKGFDSLNLIRPQVIAKATDYINEQLNLVRTLKEKGYTYQINDGIYFDTSRFSSYANFAHLDLNSLKAGARVEYNIEKKHPSDFALWKFTPKGEKRDMEWETPYDLLDAGVWDLKDENNSNRQIMGFPGWHLECSSIATSLLGNTIDIHTGGIDHIPIHHTNEIAQSESANGVKLSNYWLHCNHLKSNGTKISKSLNNGYTLQDLKDKGYSPLDFRMFVLQGHYRNEGNFTFEGLTAAKNRLKNWYNVATIRHQINNTTKSDKEKIHSEKTTLVYAFSQAIIEAVNNDLATPEALRIVDDAFSDVLSKSLNKIHRPAFIQLLETIDEVLGLKLIDNTPDISDEQKSIILERKQARKEEDWFKSDALRDRLKKQGIIVRDTNNDSIWEYA